MSSAVLEESEVMPEVAGFTPKKLQIAAHDAIWREFDAGRRSTLVNMATGVGKTILFGMVAKTAIETRGVWVLVVAHRDELLEQAQAKLAFVGVDSAIEKAQQKARRAISEAADDLYHPRDIRCVVASVQSLKGGRLASWPRDRFGYVIVDECHHSYAASYRAVLDHFLPAKVLGVTATPMRGDGGNLGEIYESEAFRYLLPQAIAEDELAPIDWRVSPVKIDISKVGGSGADLNQGDLEDAISPHIEQMVRGIKELAGDRTGILFAPGRESKEQKRRPCEFFAEALRKVDISARATWGDHPDRLAIDRAFREGEFRFLCGTQNLLGEGVDYPFVESVVLASPHRKTSAHIVEQEIGRGTRKSPGTGKSDCMVVNFTWEGSPFDLCRPFDLIRPDGPPDAAILAAEIIESGEETDLMAAVLLAESRAADRRAKLDAERDAAKAKAEEIRRARENAAESKRARLEREAINLRVRDGESGLRFARFDPFASTLQLAGLDRSPARGTAVGPRSTPRQVAALALYGVDPSEAAAMSETEAAAMRTWCYRRYSGNLATVPQWKALMRLGVERGQALAFSRKEASAYLDRFGARRRHG